MPKRTKAKKVGDVKQNKAWLRRQKPSSYQIETVEPNKTILIVCEGQTEELYFKAFPVLTAKVEAISLGQDKLKLVESTEAIVKNSEVEYDEIWCVFDMDVNGKEKEFTDFDNAIHKAHILSYKVAYSNDVFELWFYLHYFFTDQKHHRQFYYRELSKLWDYNYVKFGKERIRCLENYKRLIEDEKASQEEAIKRAEKLYESQKDLKYHQQNPVSQVYKLVKLLNENLRA